MDYSSLLKDGEESTGTTIMACIYQDGIVIGADSRTTTGAYIANRITNKIEHVFAKTFALRSGSASDTQLISDYVRSYISQNAIMANRIPSVFTAARLFQTFCYNNKDNLVASIICAGIDPYEGPQVYKIPLGGVLVKEQFAMGGSGSSYLYGFCDQHYRPGMTREECENFVKTAIGLAMSRDGSSGGCIRLLTMTHDFVERQFIPNQELPI